jgi:Dimerisation domain
VILSGSDSRHHARAAAASPCDTPTPDRLLESAMAFWRSAVLLSAHELGLFAALAAGPRDAGTLERCLGLRPDTAEDFLEALVALGLVERRDDQYRNAPEASLFLDPARPTYIGRWLTMASAGMRELADLTTHLRVASANEKELTSLADQMWADIADILRVAGAHDEA